MCVNKEKEHKVKQNCMIRILITCIYQILFGYQIKKHDVPGACMHGIDMGNS